MSGPITILRIHPSDNVAVALHSVRCGEVVGDDIFALGDVPAGHKISLKAIDAGEAVIKYGYLIGTASKDIRAGEHVHVHNLHGALAGTVQRGGYQLAQHEFNHSLRSFRLSRGFAERMALSAFATKSGLSTLLAA